MKTCFKCNTEQPLSEFYKVPLMKDGHCGKCKACSRVDAKAWRDANPEQVIANNKKYASRGYRPSPEAYARYKAANPEKVRAASMVNNAIRDGRMTRGACEICNTDEHVHGHHDDYSRPLDVRWICKTHHNEWHQLLRAA